MGWLRWLRTAGMGFVWLACLSGAAVPGSGGKAWAASPKGGSPLQSVKQSPQTVARQFVDMLAARKFAQATNLMDPRMRAALPAAQLRQVWDALELKSGTYSRSFPPRVEPLGNLDVVYVPSVFGNSTFDFKIVIMAGKVGGFFVEPHRRGYKPPSYVVSSAIVEQPIKIGSGQAKLDGTVTLPAGDGPFPVVILVHGSGPGDRDESIGPNKPFRDLAQGLASKGVAAIRYEKRTKQYPSMPGIDMKNLTVKEEVIDDAVDAVKAAASLSSIDKRRIFVLGHSLGGMLVPRIARELAGTGGSSAADAKGFIVLAGTSRPLADVMLEQYEYIASLPSANGAEARKKLPAIKAEVEKVRHLKAEDAGETGNVLGAPARYWIDLAAHDPTVEVLEVEKPILFLQGGRDYQVTEAGDFARWKSTLKDKATLHSFKLYPRLSHLFTEGAGMATPEEYLGQPGNVHEQVIRDIVDFVKTN